MTAPMPSSTSVLQPEDLESLAERVARHLPPEVARLQVSAEGADAGTVRDVLGGALRDSLEVPLSEVLLGGLARVAELRRLAADPDPKARHVVPLVRYSFSARHAPALSVEAGGAEVWRIDFQLDLTLRVAALQVTLCGGRIVALSPGRAELQLALAVEGARIWAHRVTGLELPPLSLDPGMPVLHTAGAAQ
jgi:hypothetical protein